MKMRGLEKRLFEHFRRTAYSNDPNDKILRITAANFVNLLYKSHIVDPSKWPTPRIVEEMYARGYMPHVTQKASYGAQSPPLLDFAQAKHFALVFSLLRLKERPDL